MILLNHEQEWGMMRLRQADAEFVIGIDEVGLGAVAGPLVVCGAVFHRDWSDPKVKDSKEYSSHSARMKVFDGHIKRTCAFHAIEVVNNKDIDDLGMHAALQDATRRCAVMCAVKFPNSSIAVDGSYFPLIVGHEVVAIPKGDKLIPAISAASVIAKVTRDAMMHLMDDVYPGYGFDKHVGYLTEAHRDAIHAKGPCKIHRRSYEPIKSITGWSR